MLGIADYEQTILSVLKQMTHRKFEIEEQKKNNNKNKESNVAK